MTHKLNPNLKKFWRTRRDVKVLKGGRASGKTWDCAGMAIILAAQYKLKFMCVRQFQANISDSVYTVLCEMIERMGYQEDFRILKNTIECITTGSEFLFYGFQRNTASIKGTEGVDIAWLEEAEMLTKSQWEVIEPTIRKEGSECWILYNPRLASDYVETNFKDDPKAGVLVRTINYNENPYLSKTMLRKIERAKEKDLEDYEHIYLGIPLSDDDQAIIKRSWVEAAIDAHIKLDMDLSGARCVGYDVADDGGDRNCAITFDGGIAINLDAWKAGEDELVKSAKRAWSHVEGGKMLYDSIGVGAQVGSTLKEAGFDEHHYKFNAGGEVIKPDDEYSPGITNKKKFENLKAQAWRDVADRFRNTYNAVNKGMKFGASELISISSDIQHIEELKTELCEPHKDYSKRGLDMVESKKDVKKRLEKSHDLSDAFIMGACPHLVNAEDKGFFDLEW